ncbi:MAG TPA: sugar kinase, partial [Solirubrobacteraceae bacterium]|nr:sugar kinase [Solirubrobacteraceae bacterium]
DANPDLVLRGDDLVPAFGQAERLVEDATLTVGGSGAIAACAAARLGLRVAFCGVVGDDPFGRFMREELQARGVDTRGLVVDLSRPTGLTVVFSRPQDRAMLTRTGTIVDLRLELVDRALLSDARHVHVGSYFLQTGLAPDLAALFDEARAGGTTTSVDPNWDPSEAWDHGLMTLLERTDVFLPNRTEAMRIARTSDVETAALRLASRAGVVAVKAGEDGAIGATGDALLRVAAAPVTVLDTTGAGDAFDAGFLVAWLDGAPLEHALAVANACGALSTRAVGGVDGQPTMEEALAALAAAEGSPA